MCRWFKILKRIVYLFILSLSVSSCTSQGSINSSKADINESVSRPGIETKQVVIEKDLWQYIINRYTLSAPNQKKLFWHIDWFKKNPDYLTRVTKTSNTVSVFGDQGS